MKSIKGTMTCVPADVATTVEALPRKLNDVDVVHVELKKHVDHKTVYAKENIRPAVVQRAWECLTEGELYRKEGISAVFNDQWKDVHPDDPILRHINLKDEFEMEEADDVDSEDESVIFYGGSSTVNDEIVPADSIVIEQKNVTNDDDDDNSSSELAKGARKKNSNLKNV